MCLALPVEVVERLKNNRGIISVAGVRREIALDLVPNVKIGEYVILHVGYAIAKLDQAEAEKTLELFNQMITEQS